MITPYTIDTIIYADELAYFKGTSPRNYKERKLAKRWARIQRWLTLWSPLASVALPVLASAARA